MQLTLLGFTGSPLSVTATRAVTTTPAFGLAGLIFVALAASAIGFTTMVALAELFDGSRSDVDDTLVSALST